MLKPSFLALVGIFLMAACSEGAVEPVTPVAPVGVQSEPVGTSPVVSEFDDPDRRLSGVFLDAGPVEGLNFETTNSVGETIVGVTDADGRFTFSPGRGISFSVGGVDLGTIESDTVISTLDLETSADVPRGVATRISRLLQTLDYDTFNGVQISEAPSSGSVRGAKASYRTFVGCQRAGRQSAHDSGHGGSPAGKPP